MLKKMKVKLLFVAFIKLLEGPAMARSLKEYEKKRDFSKTAEPTSKKTKITKNTIFVIQKHEASRLHYDFRLEIDGILVSWAIPKGPSLNPADKRLAVMTEDHPMAYRNFEGVIPKDQYGGGTVMIWDYGTYKSIREKDGKTIPIKAGNRIIDLSNENKILFPKSKITKGDIIDYYLKAADILVPFTKDRPLTVRRFPNGIHKDNFYQKNTPE